MTDTTHFTTIILGSGPAGLSSAIYTSRASINTLVIEGNQPGGQLTTTTEVENFPGFANGIDGNELMAQMRQQAQRFGATFATDNAVGVDFSKQPYTVSMESGTTYTCDTLIIASGATARYLGLESEQKLKGHGVSACATCDGFFFKDKAIAVIGGGDSAVEEAHFLTKFGSKVTLIHRRDQLRASKIMQQRAFDNPKIEIAWNKTVSEFVGENSLEGLRLKDTKTGEESMLECQGAFLSIGHQPNTKIFAGKVDMDENGYIVTAPKSTKTNVPGVFAAGDVQDKRYRQAVTAVGTGCMAALDAQEYLEEKGL